MKEETHMGVSTTGRYKREDKKNKINKPKLTMHRSWSQKPNPKLAQEIGRTHLVGKR
jgi:hypothetical protein